MATTPRPDITIIRGDSVTIDFELTEDGTAVDLTGATVYFTAKPTLDADVSDAAAVITVEVTSHSDPTGGITEIPLSATDTNVTPGNYYYDVQIKRADTTIASIKYRMLEIIADVTRRTS